MPLAILEATLTTQIGVWCGHKAVNIFDEFIELMGALGLNEETMATLRRARDEVKPEQFTGEPDVLKVRDALCDINVFSYGTHHRMGFDADRDMHSVLNGVMTRFIKNAEDKQATINMHAAKGVKSVYFEGDYPTMIMKSAEDQPDAPKGKFLKSASYCEPVFYEPAKQDDQAVKISCPLVTG